MDIKEGLAARSWSSSQPRAVSSISLGSRTEMGFVGVVDVMEEIPLRLRTRTDKTSAFGGNRYKRDGGVRMGEMVQALAVWLWL